MVEGLGHLRPGRSGGSQLLIAPPDLRTADPVLALDIYAGRFVFAGRAVETAGASPFEIEPPSEDWLRELHSFRWLRHLKAADTPLARSNARAITEDWIRIYRRGAPIVWDTDITAQRTLSFLAQSRLILDGADHEVYRRFVQTLVRHAVFLRTRIGTAKPGLPRLQAAIAIAMTGISLSGQARLARAGLDRLDQELKKQILPDGGHISRNPAILVQALIDLLPLRQALIARGELPSELLIGSIDRMMPMLRFFRHGDGAFAHFNGASSSSRDLVATVLSYDETLGMPISTASYSGFERVQHGESLLLVDAGAPPLPPFSTEAHAGTLSFEFSSRNQRIFINCGAPSARHLALRRAARLTAAHCTAVLADESSSEFAGPTADARIVSGPKVVTSKREGGKENRTALHLSHDGYVKRFGLIHRRGLRLAADGAMLEGTDQFAGPADAQIRIFELRFHLHHDIVATLEQDEDAMELATPDGTRWRFSANYPLELEESIEFSDVFPSRPTTQIVIAAETGAAPAVKWRLARIDE
ncbi:heparinase II/III family protein [Faunimonas pinastri]|uniref:heparinase II/III family protein n=1 Tax=Faunimonas pinastri TaxID=1855383 RepID=UPI0015A5D005|nr:heparinase II/III family protein [Faunimonas pinastri]